MRLGIRKRLYELRLKALRKRGIRIGDDCRVHRTADFDLEGGGQIRIGSGVQLGPGVILATHGADIVLNDNVYVGPYCVIYGGVVVGEHTMLAAHSVIVPANHSTAPDGVPMYQQPKMRKGIVIGRDVWIGALVTVLDGVTLADGCVIGAGSVVTKSIGPMMIAHGAPAKEQKARG